MKFAHIADCHIGSWRDSRLRKISEESFLRTASICIDENVDFVLISGDLFNTAVPPVESLRAAVEGLKKLKDKGIEIYIVPGSHDFSHGGKTMIDVLESAGLVKNTAKGRAEGEKLVLEFTEDKKTGAKITGMPGKKGGLEKEFYMSIERESIEKEAGYKIFMFHSAITELKPKEMDKMDSAPVSLLPKGFDYYAGGHVHITENTNIDGYRNIVFPGPLFPTSFSELEKLKSGSFCIVDSGKARHEQIVVNPVHSIIMDCTGKSPEECEMLISQEIKSMEFVGMIVLIRLYGKLREGKQSDIGLHAVEKELEDRGAFAVLRNTSHLSSKEFEDIKVENSSAEETEEKLIKEHSGKSGFMSAENEEAFARSLMSALSQEKEDGEAVHSFERRIKSSAENIINGIVESIKD